MNTYKKYKNFALIFLAVSFMVSGLFFSADIARAGGFTPFNPFAGGGPSGSPCGINWPVYGCPSGVGNTYIAVDTNKKVYAPGETIVVFWSLNVNPSSFDGGVDVWGNDRRFYSGSYPGHTISGTEYFTASSPGGYDFNYGTCVQDSQHCSTGSIRYTVEAPNTGGVIQQPKPACSRSDMQIETVNVYSAAPGRTGQWWCDNHFGVNLGGDWQCLSVSGGSCSSDAPQGSDVTCGLCLGDDPLPRGGGGPSEGGLPSRRPSVTISACSGVFCGSVSCDPNIQSCSNQCGSKYDCGYVDPQVIIQPIGEVVIPDPLRISWNSSYTSSCNASSDPNVWSGSKPTSGSENIFNPTSVSQRGTYSFTMSCSGRWDSAKASDTKTAKVISLPRCSFSANPSSIVLPGKSALSWNCEYASGGCSIDNNIGEVDSTSGIKNVTPSKTTTYTLNCVGLDGSKSWEATVTNAFEPIIKEVIPR